jgi:hypothetical protein
VLLLLSLAPFIHRVTHHVPLFLLAVFACTLIYNLAAFPFSAANRYKAFFVQTLDLDAGTNRVCFDGIEPYIRAIIAELPSAAGEAVECGESRRQGVVHCCFDGSRAPPRLVRSDLYPTVTTTTTAATTVSTKDTVTTTETTISVTTATTTAITTITSPVTTTITTTAPNPTLTTAVPHLTLTHDDDDDNDNEIDYTTIVRINTTRLDSGLRARLEIAADNTKACVLEFARPVTRAVVRGSSGLDERFGAWPEAGVTSVRLWRRERGRGWVVDVEWKEDAGTQGFDDDGGGGGGGVDVSMGDHDGELKTRASEGLAGAVVCLWSDASLPGTIPALDEALAYAPAWAGISKLGDGLVELRKAFEV